MLDNPAKPMSDEDRWSDAVYRHLKNISTDWSDRSGQVIARLITYERKGHVCLRVSDDDILALQLTGLMSFSSDNPLIYRSFILDDHRLYWTAWWCYESMLIKYLRRRQTMIKTIDWSLSERIEEEVTALLQGLAQRQVAAVLMALKVNTLLVVGGPGTGKTTTVAALLAALMRDHAKPLTIKLAAPTGKAADRMLKSLRQSMQRLDLTADELAMMPTESLTLHRLLGLSEHQPNPLYHEINPIKADVLVVDEVSMVDLRLFAQLLAATHSQTRLILLGDPNQLASVELGAVLADLSVSARWSDACRAMLRSQGIDLPAKHGHLESQGLLDTLVYLNETHRFDDRSGIARLAKALEYEQITDIALIFETAPDLAMIPAMESIAAIYAPLMACIRAKGRIDDCFEALGSTMVLAATQQQVQWFNEKVSLWMRQELTEWNHDATPSDQGLSHTVWYVGRVVMMTYNNYDLGLFNGDIGITLLMDGVMRVAFKQGDDYRWFFTHQLTRVETAFAITIHKSQGSEAARVICLLPETEAILNRALVYTALTRAKRHCTFVGDWSVFKAAIAQQDDRVSGIIARLS
jgi:exodeoxyribonuclease V alpha subunit